MWETYHEVVRNYSPISIERERELIALAQEGHQESRDELLLRHVGFVIFRLHRKVFRREHLRRYGEDLLSETIPLLLGKIDSTATTWSAETHRASRSRSGSSPTSGSGWMGTSSTR